MNYSAVIQNRKSVRGFTDKKISFDVVEEIRVYFENHVKRLLPELDTQLHLFREDVKASLEGAAGYNQFLVGAPQYLVLLTEKHPLAHLNAGYIMQDMILKNPDLKLVFGVGDPFALGALQSISAAQEDILVIGFDGSAEAMDEIRTGGLFKATVWDNPTMLGELCLENVAAYFAGEEVPELYEYPSRMLDITNVDE